MKQNTNNERKSFKEVVAENKGKIIAGATVITIGTVSYVLYRNTKAIKGLYAINDAQMELSRKQGELNHASVDCAKEMAEQLVIVRDIAKEGALEEAIASVKRKIQYRVGKIADLSNRPSDKDAIISKELYEKELEILKKKLTTFEKEWENMLH